jgi:hypothetical protein
MNQMHEDANADQGEQRAVVVFLRDTERGLGTGYKTTGTWREGRFDDSPWSEGEYRCDCARGPLLHWNDTFSCGDSRFRVERIVVWDTGETVYSESPGERPQSRGGMRVAGMERRQPAPTAVSADPTQ